MEEKKSIFVGVMDPRGSLFQRRGRKYSRKTGNGQEMATALKPFYLHLFLQPFHCRHPSVFPNEVLMSGHKIPYSLSPQKQKNIVQFSFAFFSYYF